MTLFRPFKSTMNSTFRKLSKSNLHCVTQASQCLRPFSSRPTCLSNPVSAKCGTQSVYRHLTSSFAPLNCLSRRNNSQHFQSPYQFYHPLVYQAGSGPVEVHATTIICVRKDDEIVMCGDGQMTIGTVVAKPNGRKLRKLNNAKAICGFAGAAADGISLVDLLERKLSERDELRRACVETSRMWRTDKILRHLNAILIVADEKATYQLTGSGELIESDTGIMAIGSGGNFAEAAARALMDRDDLSADDIAAKAMRIAGDMCIYTNHNTMKLKIKKGEGIIEDTTAAKPLSA